MNRQFFKDTFLWGFLLWLIGYVLGILLFMIVPKDMIGFFIMPIGSIITLLVLFKKIKGISLSYFFKIALIWTIMAIVLDYLFIIKLFKAGNEYYKLDVYLYYILTFTLPLLVGLSKKGKQEI